MSSDGTLPITRLRMLPTLFCQPVPLMRRQRQRSVLQRQSRKGFAKLGKILDHICCIQMHLSVEASPPVLDEGRLKAVRKEDTDQNSRSAIAAEVFIKDAS